MCIWFMNDGDMAGARRRFLDLVLNSLTGVKIIVPENISYISRFSGLCGSLKYY